MVKTQLKNLKFDAFGDGSAFILGEHQGETQEDSFCYGVDIPVEDDAKWRFWKMYDDETTSWNLTNEEKEYIKNRTAAYCLNNGYLYLTEKQYFITAERQAEISAEEEKKNRKVKWIISSATIDSKGEYWDADMYCVLGNEEQAKAYLLNIMKNNKKHDEDVFYDIDEPYKFRSIRGIMYCGCVYFETYMLTYQMQSIDDFKVFVLDDEGRKIEN